MDQYRFWLEIENIASVKAIVLSQEASGKQCHSTAQWIRHARLGRHKVRKSFLRTPLILCVLSAFYWDAIMHFSENYLSGLLLYRSGHHQTTDLNHLLRNPNPLRNPSWPLCTTTRPLGRLAHIKPWPTKAPINPPLPLNPLSGLTATSACGVSSSIVELTSWKILKRTAPATRTEATLPSAQGTGKCTSTGPSSMS